MTTGTHITYRTMETPSTNNSCLHCHCPCFVLSFSQGFFPSFFFRWFYSNFSLEISPFSFSFLSFLPVNKYFYECRRHTHPLRQILALQTLMWFTNTQWVLYSSSLLISHRLLLICTHHRLVQKAPVNLFQRIDHSPGYHTRAYVSGHAHTHSDACWNGSAESLLASSLGINSHSREYQYPKMCQNKENLTLIITTFHNTFISVTSFDNHIFIAQVQRTKVITQDKKNLK